MSYGVVYKITNKNDGKCYIGKTTQYLKRMGDHSLTFDPKEHTFKILAEYDNEKELDAAEKYWIWRYNAYNQGYNKRCGGKIMRKINKIKNNDIFDIEEVEFSKIVKIFANKTTHYVSIPQDILNVLNIKRGDAVHIKIKKMNKEEKNEGEVKNE